MSYQIIDITTANLIAEHETAREVISTLRGFMEMNGDEAASELGVTRVDERGNLHTVAGGGADTVSLVKSGLFIEVTGAFARPSQGGSTADVPSIAGQRVEVITI